MAAVLIYVNAVDYLVSNLLKDMQLITNEVTKKELGAIVFFEDTKRKEEPLGRLIEHLRKYSFPDKKGFIDNLHRFNSLRKKMVHQLSDLTEEDRSNIDGEINTLFELSEDIFNQYDNILQGIVTAWRTYIAKYEPQTMAEIKSTT